MGNYVLKPKKQNEQQVMKEKLKVQKTLQNFQVRLRTGQSNRAGTLSCSPVKHRHLVSPTFTASTGVHSPKFHSRTLIKSGVQSGV